jgi:hypothetical protein
VRLVLTYSIVTKLANGTGDAWFAKIERLVIEKNLLFLIHVTFFPLFCGGFAYN